MVTPPPVSAQVYELTRWGYASETAIKELPLNGRNALSLVLLTPAQKAAATAAATGTANLLDHPFTPKPFGKDLYAIYGNDYALPLIGNFDDATGLPLTPSGGNVTIVWGATGIIRI